MRRGLHDIGEHLIGLLHQPVKRFRLALQIDSANLLLLNCIQVFSEDPYLTTILLTLEGVLIYRLE